MADWYQSKPRELKTVHHREWQAGETKSLLQNEFANRAEESRARRVPLFECLLTGFLLCSHHSAVASGSELAI